MPELIDSVDDEGIAFDDTEKKLILGPKAYLGPRQILYAEAPEGVDTTHAGTGNPVTLLEVPITTTGGDLLIQAVLNGSIDTIGSGFVALCDLTFDDGIPAVFGAGALVDPDGRDFRYSLQKLITGVAPGVHSVKLRWGVNAGRTIRVKRFQAPNSEGASLLVQELSQGA